MNSLPVFGAPGIAKVPTLGLRPRFYLPEGDIESAWALESSPHRGSSGRKSGAQKAGLAYQKRIGNYLSSRDGQWNVVSGPWYCYVDGSCARHYCQPDFLLLDEANKCCVVVEVKIRWTSDAWWQLTKLYLPVLQRVRPDLQMFRLAITRSFDPAIPSPEAIELIDDLLSVKPDRFNVLVVR